MQCSDFGFLLKVIAYLINIIRFLVPIILIILITVDIIKAIMANDEKQLKTATSNSGKRVLFAIVLFLVPTIVIMIFKFLGNNVSTGELNGFSDWISCFNSYF